MMGSSKFFCAISLTILLSLSGILNAVDGEANLKRVKRAESGTRCNPGVSSRGGTEPQSFIEQNEAPMPAYPPKGSGAVALGRKLKDGLPTPPQVIRLRASLPDSNPNEGRVEILRDNKWGLVCDGHWDKAAADVACKQLGFKGGCRLTKRNSAFGLQFGTKNKDVTVGEVRCTGKERSILDCSYKKPKCKKTQTAGVVCYYNDGCPYGWTSYDGMCYRLEKSPKTFLEAQKACQAKKANLVNYLNDNESNFMSTLLKLRFPEVTATWSGGIWMEKRGLDSRRYGAWVWTGTIQTVSSKANHAWFPGFGSSGDKRPILPYRNRSCIAISTIFIDKDKGDKAIDTNYYWWDNISCKQKLPFICQRPNFKWRGRSSSASCYSGDGSSYRGTASRTLEGSICERWTNPYSTQTPLSAPGKGLGDHNYCRNPDGDAQPWCWVNAKKGEFGYCEISKCEDKPAVPDAKATVHPPNGGFGISDCRADQYFCPSMYRYRYGCIEKSKVCNGRKDCNDGEDEDEKFCRKYRCTDQQFYCHKNNYCIKKSMACDGTEDCSDGADEKNCQNMGNPLSLFQSTPNKVLVGQSTVYFHNKTECAKQCQLSARKGPPCMSFNYMPANDKRRYPTCNILKTSIRQDPSQPLKDFNGASHWEYKPDCGGQDVLKCKNGRCLLKKLKCNNIDDCGDNSDEENCGDKVKAEPLQVRLRGGEEEYEGRVEVRHNGEWGLVCDKDFDKKDGDVICKMLGYKSCLKAKKRTYQEYGRGNGNMIVSKLACEGNEANIDQCKHNGWRKHSCRGYQVAGVVCQANRACTSKEFRCVKDQICVPLKTVCNNKQDCSDGSDEASCEMKVSLKNGKNDKEGLLVVTINDISGTVCKDSFDDKDAQVFCRMLGFQGHARAVVDGKFGVGAGIIWLDDIGCKGDENSVKKCPRMSWVPSDCSHKEDVGIRCDVSADAPPGTRSGSTTGPFKCGQRPLMVTRGRIIGGFDAQPGQFPWQVGVRRKGPDYTIHWCGGTIISHKWILSACHCYERPKNEYMVVAGDRDNNEDEGTEQNFELDLMILHPKYTGPPAYDYDLTLLKVQPRAGNKYIEFNDYTQPACLPTANMKIRDARECFISGWGSVGGNRFPKMLQAIGVPLISDKQCREYHPGAITERMQCAGFREGGKDSCQGDSGGPLACKMKDGRWTAWGQTSWGLVCAAPNAPGVYAKVTSLLKWINETITEHGGL